MRKGKANIKVDLYGRLVNLNEKISGNADLNECIINSSKTHTRAGKEKQNNNKFNQESSVLWCNDISKHLESKVRVLRRRFQSERDDTRNRLKLEFKRQ